MALGSFPLIRANRRANMLNPVSLVLSEPAR
jgi:hypothetical protein